jgi:hypothetical protein
VLAGLAFVAIGCGSGRPVSVGPGADASGSVPFATAPACPYTSLDHDEPCGPDPEQLRRDNLRYADRVPFTGDVAAAQAVAEEVRAALVPLADVRPAPPLDDVKRALATWEPNIGVSANAVGAAGSAFAVSVPGGCVFGGIREGNLRVEVGGYVNDGGCLAVYGH